MDRLIFAFCFNRARAFWLLQKTLGRCDREPKFEIQQNLMKLNVHSDILVFSNNLLEKLIIFFELRRLPNTLLQKVAC